jgi:alkylation response protein AidB-like acyl-CoA dehydrogenase
MTADVLAAARGIAEDVLFPAAMRTDAADVLPVSQLDALAAAGLYGVFGPLEEGGLSLDFPAVCAVVEELAGGCLATAFVWIQHFGLLGALIGDDAPAHMRASWLGPACRGELRGGIALAGLLPGPPRLRARPVDDGWMLDGTAPWVTGWGRVNVLLVAARGPADTIVTLVLDAVEQAGLAVARQYLAAVHASMTVRLDFTGVLVPANRLVSHAQLHPGGVLGGPALRVNGSLALGVAGRCCRLLGPSPLDDELDACRQKLDQSDSETMPGARAAASELALRAAAALAVHDGSQSITRGQHAQRLAREALFLLVFGSRPGIRADLLRLFGAVSGQAATPPSPAS